MLTIATFHIIFTLSFSCLKMEYISTCKKNYVTLFRVTKKLLLWIMVNLNFKVCFFLQICNRIISYYHILLYFTPFSTSLYACWFDSTRIRSFVSQKTISHETFKSILNRFKSVWPSCEPKQKLKTCRK